MLTLLLVKLAHLAGLVMGLGGAMLGDYTTLTRGVLRPVSAYTLQQMQMLSRIVSIGLAVLWISGIAVIWINTLANPEYITNQKLWAKVIIVAVLTLNGVLIHKAILPFLQRAAGRKLFDGATQREIAFMTMCGSLSFVSWTMPFVLAKASVLNYVTPVQNILSVYVICVAVIWLGMYLGISGILRLQAINRTVAAMNPGAAANRRILDNRSNLNVASLTLLWSIALFAWAMVLALAMSSEAKYLPSLPAMAVIYFACLAVAGLSMVKLMRMRIRDLVREAVRKAVLWALLPHAQLEMMTFQPARSRSGAGLGGLQTM